MKPPAPLAAALLIFTMLLCALFTVGGLGAWIDSHRAVRSVTLGAGEGLAMLSTSEGVFYAEWRRDVSPSRIETTRRGWAGFRYRHVVDGGYAGGAGHGTIYRQVGVPLWAVVLVGFVGGLGCVAGWRRWRRARRVGAGRCPACGYDRRGSEGPCPECGHGQPCARAR